VNIRSSRDKQRGHLYLAAIDGAAQRRFTEAVARLQVRAAIQQRCGDFHIAAPGRHVQRCAALDAFVGVHIPRPLAPAHGRLLPLPRARTHWPRYRAADDRAVLRIRVRTQSQQQLHQSAISGARLLCKSVRLA